MEYISDNDLVCSDDNASISRIPGLFVMCGMIQSDELSSMLRVVGLCSVVLVAHY